jgi:hypothetical protein
MMINGNLKALSSDALACVGNATVQPSKSNPRPPLEEMCASSDCHQEATWPG